MADDERSGADDFEDDAVRGGERDVAGEKSVDDGDGHAAALGGSAGEYDAALGGSAGEYDAALGGSAGEFAGGYDAALGEFAGGYDAALGEPDAALGEPDAASVGPADAAADTVAGELGALFAAALADEPPSTVTAESVLREVRAGGRAAGGGFAAWLASGPLSLKWASGLVAAAALVAAVVVLAPNTGGGSSVTAAGPQMSDSAAGAESDKASEEPSTAASGSAGGADSADSGAGIASAEMAPEAAPMSGVSEMSSSSESSEAASGAEAYSLESAAADGDASSAERAAETSGAPATGSESAAASSSGSACALPPLAPAEWAAAVAALPPDVTTTQLSGRGCQAGALRGGGIDVARGGEQAGTVLWIVVSDGEIGRDGAAADSTVVSASHGEITVTVIANQGGDPWLDETSLHRLADAVAAAG